MTSSCSTLVLDLDGTISDPSLGIVRSTNHALTACGYATAAPAAIRRLIGPPLDTLFHSLVPNLSAADITALVAAYRERYSDIGYTENQLYPDIVTTLKQLASQQLRMGVCTSKRQDFAVRIVEMFGLAPQFAFVNGGEVGVSKARQLAGLLDCGAIDQHAIMVGDRAVDLAAAAANSLRSIGVLWGFGNRDELEQESPWQIVASPAELVSLVG